MSNGLIEGSNIIQIGDEEVELKKLTLGNLETLEKTYGSIDKALGSMKGITHAIFLAAKRSGFQGKMADVSDNIEFDQIQTVIGAISSQRTLVLSAEEAKTTGDLLAAALLADESEDAVASVVSIANKHRDTLVSINRRAEAIQAPSGEARGVNA